MKMNYTLSLYLGAPGEQASSNVAADIYFQYPDGSGMLNVWDEAGNLPSVGALVSWARLETKISECHEEHDRCRQKVQRVLPQGFRVIDITRRRIVETTDVAFIALSYVWGVDTRSPLLTATRATISGMKEDGGLPTLEMPRTIEDAMTISTRLGERYLWVDRLCIIQDDPKDKMNQIEAMSDVYTSARLVLIAAYGNNMDFGIHGISFTNIIREPEDDPLALWHTRGWTYQEAVLARRRLFFTNVRAYFECVQSTCHEDAYNSETDPNEFTSYELLMKEDRSRFEAFARHLRNYTSRSLSYQWDVYNAITGITKALYEGKSTFINGLPQVDFDRALRWFADLGNTSLCRLETEEISCPTWSWSAIMNRADQVRYQETALYGTLALWYKKDTSSFAGGQLQAVNLHSETEMDDNWSLYMAIACEQGLVGSIPTCWSPTTDSFSTICERFNMRWPDYPTFCKEAIPSAKWPQWCQKTNSLLPALRQGVLLTATQSGLLRLRERSPKTGLSIIDAAGDIVGELCGDVSQLTKELTAPHHDQNASYEFIALSLSGQRLRPYIGQERETKNYFDVGSNPLDTLPIVNLLMVGWRGKYAYRRELGWVYMKDWIEVDREWKVVMHE
ncbi:hypothetical protein EPUS_05702 [Endocarpon pusillum Z07020]|uniref:Heterokaryon incompatibility domain-containing protein n=1 Tax=Endocarpon pusillum (strain Z07020 / HMAS-L-300199) TaxID=1263415 RepID=U1GKE9_ENDPU|nr:uncharacterized protein EPUS_05702 [Endocarpon pusillum Z07020]ERF72648.1 hypothetical protein EPUS_05702 [Endocarpon pusillum Z07020]